MFSNIHVVCHIHIHLHIHVHVPVPRSLLLPSLYITTVFHLFTVYIYIVTYYVKSNKTNSFPRKVVSDESTITSIF